MTFDPFGDFETRGYLRNFVGEKDSEIVRRLEHTSLMTGIDSALDRLATIKRISYQDVLDTHRILFEAVYPWAEQDRLQTAPDLAEIAQAPGLDGNSRQNEVLGKNGLRSNFRYFSERALINNPNHLDFDSAMRRFESSRRSQIP